MNLALKELISGDPMEVKFCLQSAKSLSSSAGRFFDKYVFDENRKFKFPKGTDVVIEEYELSMIMRAAATFETNFAAEMREAATYYVPRIGIYETTALIDDATRHLPEEVQGHLRKEAKMDFQEAGKCFGFGLYTACGFHLMRTVEACLHDYHALFLGSEAKDRKTMGDYIGDLKKKAKSPPAQKTLRILEQIKDLDRNPLMHPRAYYTQTDAWNLFQLVSSGIATMLGEIHDRGEELNQLPLALEAGKDEGKKIEAESKAA